MINKLFDGIADMSDHSETKVVVKLPISLIAADPEQPRKYFDRDSILGIADSIKAYGGLITPMIVRKLDNGSFMLIAGERRYRALTFLSESDKSFASADCLVRDVDDVDDIEFESLTDNVAREPLLPVEEADAYKRLMDRGHSLGDICLKTGRNKSYVKKRLAILGLSSDVVRLARTGRIVGYDTLNKLDKSVPSERINKAIDLLLDDTDLSVPSAINTANESNVDDALPLTKESLSKSKKVHLPVDYVAWLLSKYLRLSGESMLDPDTQKFKNALKDNLKKRGF